MNVQFLKSPALRISLLVLVTGLSLWVLRIEAQSSSINSDSEERTGWTRTELYYGAGRLPADPAREARWDDYINNVVTPRFPEGLTLLEGTGQWRVKEGQTPRRNRTRILILIHEDTPEKSKQVDEIRSLWIEISGHQSVLRVSQPAYVAM